MARTHTYACTTCGTMVHRDQLQVKKVVFSEMGVAGAVMRSRVIAWLCPSCLTLDPDYNRQPYQVAGGNQLAV